MKTFLLPLGVACAFLCVSCGGSSASSESENVGTTDAAYVEQLRSWGAADVFIDRENRVLLYGVTAGEGSGDPDEVARLHYEDAISSGIRGIDECRIVELPGYKVLGRYKNRK